MNKHLKTPACKILRLLATPVLALLILTLFTPALMAQQQLTDGPYLFYHSDSVLIQRVIQGRAVSQSMPVAKAKASRVQVGFPEKPEWNFEVTLQQDISAPPSTYPEVNKALILSDTEGEFQGLRELLVANRVMDQGSRWTFGKGHLIICGDLFDRGKQVTQQLWLLYHLETQAKKAGGLVHVILGNHDIMNLSGDLRYLQPSYLESAKAIGTSYMSLYAENTELGRWLRSRNIIEKIGSQLYAHAGISADILRLNLDLQQINTLARPYYATPQKELPENVRPIFGPDGIFWYRGYFMKPKATMAQVEETLARFGADRIIVGHTIVNRNIASYYRGKVIGADVDHHAGSHYGLLLRKGKFYVADTKGDLRELEYRPENDQIEDKDIL